MTKSLVKRKREELPDKIPLRCPHCEYEWEYGGTSPFYATCPQCRKQFKLRGHRTDLKMANTEQVKIPSEGELEEGNQEEEVEDELERLDIYPDLIIKELNDDFREEIPEEDQVVLYKEFLKLEKRRGRREGRVYWDSEEEELVLMSPEGIKRIKNGQVVEDD